MAQGLSHGRKASPSIHPEDTDGAWLLSDLRLHVRAIAVKVSPTLT